MVRTLITYVIPFLLPILAYLVWVWYRVRYAKRHGGKAPALEQGPWPLLLFLGTILVLGVMGTTALMRGSPAGSSYTPPKLENGRVIPGRLED